MQFRLELQPEPSKNKITPGQRIALIGSCFTTHMAERLCQAKFTVEENPFGVVFNPISIANQLNMILENRRFSNADLFEANELQNSWFFHSRFSHPEASAALEAMNNSVDNAHAFMKDADWLILTLGSAFTYRIFEPSANAPAGFAVANCHRVPANRFDHRLENVENLKNALAESIRMVRQHNPDIKIVFTISPVRHYREGLIENNRSKSALHLTVMDLCNTLQDVQYFPAYELVIDDLRDYRFYAEDMVHPNYAATGYVWEKFAEAYFQPEGKRFLEEMKQLRLAVQHRSLHPGSAMHAKFRAKMLENTRSLQDKYPFLDLSEELLHFS